MAKHGEKFTGAALRWSATDVEREAQGGADESVPITAGRRLAATIKASGKDG